MSETLTIDVSSNNGDLDFAKVRAHGARGVFFKVTEGATFIDYSFGSKGDPDATRLRNLRVRYASIKAGKLAAVPYHFARQDNHPSDGAGEARFFCDVLKAIGYPQGCAVVLDHEKGTSTREWHDQFTEVCRVRGYRPSGIMVYGGRFHLLHRPADHAALLWLAAYVSRPTFATYAAVMRKLGWTVKQWQYTSTAKVSGAGVVDANRWFGTAEDLLSWADPDVKPPKPQPKPPAVSGAPVDTATLQRALNAFTGSGKWLWGYQPIVVDGRWGPQTAKRLAEVKYYLGYGENRSNGARTAETLERIKDPARAGDAKMRRTAKVRRVRQRTQWAKIRLLALPNPHVGFFDGVPVAKWMIPHLEWARAHGGWKGWLISAYRSKAYSRRLCIAKCGQPQCPGTCAGDKTRHTGTVKPDGAVDVTEPAQFEAAMARCPHSPKLRNALPKDRNHFSVVGN